MKDDTVFIEDSNGSSRRLRLFLSPVDGDIYVGIVEPSDRLGLNSVRICTHDGNPAQGDINSGLRDAFKAALNRGYGENHPFVNPLWESRSMRMFRLEEELRELKG